MFQQFDPFIRSTLHRVAFAFIDWQYTTLDFQSSGMLPSFTIPLHKSNIHWIPISPFLQYHFCYQSRQSWGFRPFHLLQYCSHFGHPDAICWSFLNLSRYLMVSFILFIHQFLHVLLPRVFDPFTIYNHFP